MALFNADVVCRGCACTERVCRDGDRQIDRLPHTSDHIPGWTRANLLWSLSHINAHLHVLALWYLTNACMASWFPGSRWLGQGAFLLSPYSFLLVTWSTWSVCPHLSGHVLSGRGGCLRPFQYPNSKGPAWLRFPTTDVFWPKRHVGLSAILWHQLDVVVLFSFERAPCPKGKNKCEKGHYQCALGLFWFAFFFNKYLRKRFKLHHAKIGDRSLTPPFFPKARALKRNENL